MTTKILLSTILIWATISCNHRHTIDAPKQEIPKALEDKTVSIDIISKRGSNDLVQSLYAELISKNIDLKTLEDNIDELKKSKGDSSNSFDKFNEKNQSYYNDANRHCEDIKDSTLRNKMRVLIAKNLTKYNTSIARHSDLLKIIDTKELTITDLHNLLKIVKTLPVIELYQKDNLPSTKPLEGYLKKQDQTIKLANKITE